MAKDTFQLGFNTQTQMAYVYKSKDEKHKNHREYDNPIITGFMPQILDNTTGFPHKMCPVRSYENYLNHLNKMCPHLWQTPNPAAFKNGNHIWYKNKRIRENKIGSFFTELSKDAKLSHQYSNHCIRVSGTTNLTLADFSANQIMSVTGHKSVNSLAMYQRVKSDEKLMMGMSLAFNLLNPQEVYEKLNNGVNQAIAPALPALVTPQQNKIAISNASSIKETPTKNDQMQIVQIPDNDNSEVTPDFDLLDFINDASDQEIVMAATQMERQYEKEFTLATTTTKTSIMTKSPKKSAPMFNNCKIGSINIHIPRINPPVLQK